MAIALLKERLRSEQSGRRVTTITRHPKKPERAADRRLVFIRTAKQFLTRNERRRGLTDLWLFFECHHFDFGPARATPGRCVILMAPDFEPTCMGDVTWASKDQRWECLAQPHGRYRRAWLRG